MRPRKTIEGKIVALTIGKQDWDRVSVTTIQAELDGLVGDKHRGYTRVAFDGDKEAEGTVRRNERQWSAMSIEEITQIQANMDLVETLTCLDVSVNIVFEGISNFSQLPKGTKFIFPSGAKLINVEYNPPCTSQGEVLAQKFITKTGVPLTRTSFSVAAIGLRGLVGVVDVAGEITVGDQVLVEIWDESCQINKPRVSSK